MRGNKVALSSLIAWSLTLIHCGSDSQSMLIDSTQANRTIAGIWQTTSGDMFARSSYGSPKYVELNENGSGAFYFQNATQALYCEEILFSVLTSQSVVIQRSVSAGTTSFDMSLFQFQSGQLSLSDNGGETLVLDQATAVPDGLKCKSFASSTFYRDLTPAPESSTGLAYDGTKLWYTGNDTSTKAHAFDLTSHAVDESVTFSEYLYIHAVQLEAPNFFFWAYLGSGSNETASRRDNLGVEQDKINTNTELTHQISIDAMAWDGTSLWLYGEGHDSGVYEILKVDPTGPTLLSSTTFDLHLHGMTWDGQSFWAVSDGGVYQIDPATMKVTATYRIPDANVRWYGIAAVSTDLYLVGKAESGSSETAVIAKVTP